MAMSVRGPAYAAEVRVDATRQTPLRHIWTYVGYDEPNYTYTPAGRELLAKLGRLGDAPYYIRCHFLLCNGEGAGAPKWGYSNVYTEDAQGRPVYSWDIIDRILDTIVACGCIPFVELGFMPRALTSAPAGTAYEGARAEGWGYPPRDYSRWLDLVRALAAHCVERHGLREVSRWYWELWNEPDIFYWRGTVEEYCRLYDYTVAGLLAAIPQATVGGPGTTSPGRPEAGAFLRTFLEHCTRGVNAVTGARGTRLDYVSFHTKGGGYGTEPCAPKKTPSLHTLTRHVAAGLAIIAEFPELCGHEVVLSECDPDGWAAGTTRDNPNLAYRNSEYYASYVGATACKLIDLADERGPRVDAMLTWAFQFEDREYFEGLRTLSTNGVDKPVLNVLRLLGALRGARVALSSDAARDPLAQEGADTPDVAPDVSGIAALDACGALRVLLVSHHDDWDVNAATAITMTVTGLAPGRRYAVYRLAVDAESANAHTAWQRMGAPAHADADQRTALIDAARLRRTHLFDLSADGSGRVILGAELGSHGAYLFELLPAIAVDAIDPLDAIAMDTIEEM
ncbi:MAG TPA: beta-xylosidase [Chloroflexi bacterium]|jgi:xylan 1,4-beta-xylosidase|nr:beta-xylosidase [Chloroflexota bacterium]